jgi:UDP-N-acetylmuramate-alanine ligase
MMQSPLIVIPPLPSGKYKLGLKGEHNYSNAAMAIALSKIWTMQRQGKKLSDITIGTFLLFVNVS